MCDQQWPFLAIFGVPKKYVPLKIIRYELPFSLVSKNPGTTKIQRFMIRINIKNLMSDGIKQQQPSDWMGRHLMTGIFLRMDI